LRLKRSILFIAPHRPDRAPSQRFRFEQYLSYLEDNGYDCHMSFLVNSKDDTVFYAKGKYFSKSYLFIKYFLKRLRDIFKAQKFDIVYIQREMFFLGPAFFEYLLSQTKAKIVYDFDDSIWLPNVSEANKNLNWLKSFSKIKKIISYADLVFAGNAFLKDFALNNNPNVFIIPTTIDTNIYKKDNKNKHDNICVGWSGSITTIQHFKFAEPFLKILKDKYGHLISYTVIGDKNYKNNIFEVTAKDWKKTTELDDLNTFDIGIMPLPNDMWANGKCGLKGLQYMALEIPTIMSPVGVNKTIIQDGENGFLADGIDEWVAKLSLLIESETLRKQIGTNARKTVVNTYSFDANKSIYLNHFNSLI